MIATIQTTLAELAVKHPAASKVFHRNGLDFCCHGNRSLEDACHERGLAVDEILADIEAEDRACHDARRWDGEALPDLIAHIVSHYHQRLREELPRLIQMAADVERAHAEKAACPHGLRDHLESTHGAVLEHLAKEETVL